MIQFAAWPLLSGLVGNLGSSVLKCRTLLDHLSETSWLSYSFQDSLPGIEFHFAISLELMLCLALHAVLPKTMSPVVLDLVLLAFQYLLEIGLVLLNLYLDLGLICQDLIAVAISTPISAIHTTLCPLILIPIHLKRSVEFISEHFRARYFLLGKVIHY